MRILGAATPPGFDTLLKTVIVYLGFRFATPKAKSLSPLRGSHLRALIFKEGSILFKDRHHLA